MIREFFHQPVMINEVLACLRPKPGGIYVDCTVGAGGHSREILKMICPDGRLVGLDRDPFALEYALKSLSEYREQVMLFNENFINLPQVLEELGMKEVDGLLYDLGVSSPQLDDPRRGFSYMIDGPLDMRMNPLNELTARDLVNDLSRKELAEIFWRYGEERWAKRIAAFIVKERERHFIETTGQLVEIIKKAIPASARRKGPHPARRTFQALRIAVNNELKDLAKSLTEAVYFLKPGGKICVISFHSLEDRIVKRTFKEMTFKGRTLVCIITSRPLTPSPEEVAVNPRSRSAKLRVAERI